MIAAGALVWRKVGRTVEVLLVHRPRYNDWSIPKGKLKAGESIQAAAVREVEEETGVAIALGQPLGSVRYRLSDGKRKVSHFWAATPIASSSPALKGRDKVKRAPAKEIDDVRWVNLKTAEKMLTMASDRDLLGQLADLRADDKLETWTLVLVRHGQALKRSQWKKGKGSEETRPLTKRGETQAKHLVPILGAYGIEHLITSPWKRCASTLDPYATATRLKLDKRDELTEAAHEKKPKKVATIVDDELAHRDVPAAMCVHRPTMPTVLGVVTKRAPYAILKRVPDKDPWLKPGELLVAHVAQARGKAARLVALETLRPSSIEHDD